jgi:hypothetical protein
MDRSWIDKFVAGARVPGEAIAGLSREELNATPIPQTWSIQQIIIHLMDSDLIGTDRMKRVAAEDRPSLIGYNETAFANSLFPDQLDPVMACEVFEKNRLLTGEILRRLPNDVFEKTGMHNEDGVVSLGVLVEKYVQHLDHHMTFIRKKRELLGKPL